MNTIILPPQQAALDVPRPTSDHYRTPPECDRSLLTVESFPGGWHDFCAGDGLMAAVLAEQLPGGIASTIEPPAKTYYRVLKGDFFALRGLPRPHLIGNPHYGRLNHQADKHALERFVRHALALLEAAGPRGGKLAIFADLRWFMGLGRNCDQALSLDGLPPLFSTHPPARIHAFADRITLYPAGWTGKRTSGSQSFAWFIWEYPFFRPGYAPPLLVDLDSRQHRCDSDREVYDWVPVGAKGDE